MEAEGGLKGERLRKVKRKKGKGGRMKGEGGTRKVDKGGKRRAEGGGGTE